MPPRLEPSYDPRDDDDFDFITHHITPTLMPEEYGGSVTESCTGADPDEDYPAAPTDHTPMPKAATGFTVTSKPSRSKAADRQRMLRLIGIKQEIKSAAGDGVRIGTLLRQAKDMLGHSRFLRWLEEAGLPFGARQCQKYMKSAER